MKVIGQVSFFEDSTQIVLLALVAVEQATVPVGHFHSYEVPDCVGLLAFKKASPPLVPQKRMS